MPWTYRPDLDGLRSVAVYLVLLFHAGMSAFDGGFVGVDLFFVLSGFVVTNVLLAEFAKHGRIDLGGFYARRVRRLLPAALVVIVATAVVFLLIVPVVRRLPLVTDAQSALLYVANWNFAFKNNDYFAADVEQSPFLHFWSLAIEEQFYVVFPILLLVLLRAARKRSWVLLGVLGALFTASVASQLYWSQVDPSWAYYGTDARLYQLLAGGILAVVLSRATRLPSPGVAHGVALAGLGGLLLISSGLISMTPTWRGLGATVTAVALIAGLMVAKDQLLSRLLSMRAPVFLGKVSYGTYLWHWPVILVLGEFLDVRPAVIAGLAAVLSTGLAALSFELLELPVRTAKALRPFRWSVAATGVACSAVVAVSVVPAMLASERVPRVSVSPAAATTEAGDAPLVPRDTVAREKPTREDHKAPVPRDTNWEEILDDFGPNHTCSADAPDDCIVVEGDGPHLTLIGDSHARMLGPAFIKLAKDHDLTLSMNVVPSCPWQEGVLNKQPPRAHADKCVARRGEWYDKALPKLDPDVVVLSTLSRDGKEWEKDLVRLGGEKEGESLSELNLDTTLETLAKIEAKGARALVVKNVLTAGEFNPIECLSGAQKVAECAVPVAEPPVSDSYYQIAADRQDDVFTLDLNPIVCGREPVCLPVQDGTVVFRDDKHLTTKITTERTKEIWRAIKRSGALQGL